MPGERITAANVAEIDRLLAAGMRPAKVAKRTGVTSYVVRVIRYDKERIGRPTPTPKNGRRYPDRPNAIDMPTVRMIQRMLQVGILRHYEIAREAGVSTNFVTLVSQGKRVACDTSRPLLAADERFLAVPIRCTVCCRRISIMPCRACRTLQEMKNPLGACEDLC